MQQLTRDQFDTLARARPAPRATLVGDSYSDVSIYWENMFPDTEDSVQAVFEHTSLPGEIYGQDADVWSDRVDLIGLRITDEHGRLTCRNRAEALDILGADSVAEIEADQQAVIDRYW